MYTWKVYKDINYLSSIQSASVDPRFFKIAPYSSLQASTVYTIAVYVNVDNNRYLYSDSVLLQIGQSGVMAKISGGNPRTVSVSQTIIVDASGSSDIDYPRATLQYTWTCVVHIPNFGGNCIGFKDPGVPVLTVKPFFFNVSTVNLTVTVSNSAGYRSSAVCQLVVISASIPTVQITRIKAKYNPDSVIILTGVVSSGNGSAVAHWTSPTVYNLSAVVSTSLSKVTCPMSQTFKPLDSA
jgi:hypothetical protein